MAPITFPVQNLPWLPGPKEQDSGSSTFGPQAPLQPHGPPSASAPPGHPQQFICSTLPHSLPVHLLGQSSSARTTVKAVCQALEPRLVLAEQKQLSSRKLSQISFPHPPHSKVTASSSVLPEPLMQIFTKDKDPASMQEYRTIM